MIQLAQLFAVIAESGIGMLGKGVLQGVGGNKGVAIAVASNPTANVQNIGQGGVGVGLF